MNSQLWQRLREARKRKSLTQQQVADWFGLSREAVSLWETARADKRTNPSMEQLQRFARETGVPLEAYLLNDQAHPGDAWNGEGQPRITPFNPDDPVPDQNILVAEQRVQFSAGPGRSLSYEAVEESEPATYRLSWFQKERINPAKVKRFRVSGQSMEPMLFPGDTILVNLAETEVREGKVYALRYGDELRVKILYPKLDGSLLLRSVNRDQYPDETVPRELVEEHITIIGRVRDKSGRGGL